MTRVYVIQDELNEVVAVCTCPVRAKEYHDLHVRLQASCMCEADCNCPSTTTTELELDET